jgi:hypothetical protein
MSASRRILTVIAAVVTAAAAAATAATAAMAAPAVHAAGGRGPAAKPGRTASPITLDRNVEFSGYDAATDSSGRTYIGWISDKNNKGRKVHLCTLPPGATKCAGGVQTIDSLGDSSAEGLRVLVSGTGGSNPRLVPRHHRLRDRPARRRACDGDLGCRRTAVRGL